MRISLKPKLITFDVNGTLLQPKLEMYIKVAEQRGFPVDEKKVAASLKANLAKMTMEHPIFGKHTGLGWENWWKTIVRNVYQEQKLNIPRQELEKVKRNLLSRCIL